ncbi:DUF6531 domain-containing protein [Chitinimonas lacunae]|uniref:DUF6531 domain-containing protein n=1 Tax=Chitinimonas lacunae TaxID=1963018 RepID=A0ABV8MTD5_9NEIS
MKFPIRYSLIAQSLSAAGAIGLAQAGTCDPKGGVTQIGIEVSATSDRFNDGSFYYEQALLQCVGGQIVALITTSAESTPEAAAQAVMSQPNMKRLYRNVCGSHIVVLHNNYKGTLNGAGPNPTTIAGMLYFKGDKAKCAPVGGPNGPDPVNFGTCFQEEDPNSQDVTLQCGNPIQPATGNKYQVETDYMGAGSNRLRVERHYNSLDGGWTMPFSQRLLINTSGSGGTPGISAAADPNLIDCDTLKLTSPETPVSVCAIPAAKPPRQIRRASGRLIPFTADSGSDHAGLGYTLAKDGSGWQLTTPNDTVERYDSEGRLLSIRLRDGYLLTTALDAKGRVTAISDQFGHRLIFAYNAQNRLDSITDPAGSVVGYQYDAQSRLAAVVYPDQTTRRYHYEDSRHPQALTGITDENGQRFATWSYDDKGRALTSEHAKGVEKVSVSYGSANQVSYTSATGAKTTASLQTVKGRVLPTERRIECTNCPTSNEKFEYDAEGRMTRMVDSAGAIQSTSYDARRLPQQQVEALGTPQARTRHYQWHASLHQPTRIDEPGRRTDFVYENGRVSQRTVTDTLRNQSRTWRYTWTANGLLSTQIDPSGAKTSYAYDAAGNLSSITRPGNLSTQFSDYDPNGRARRIVGPEGVITTRLYDSRGRLQSQTVGSQTTHYEYDKAGQPTRQTRPDGSWMSWQYDAAHRLVQVNDSAGNRLDYQYDAMSRVTRIDTSDPKGRLRTASDAALAEMSPAAPQDDSE